MSKKNEWEKPCKCTFAPVQIIYFRKQASKQASLIDCCDFPPTSFTHARTHTHPHCLPLLLYYCSAVLALESQLWVWRSFSSRWHVPSSPGWLEHQSEEPHWITPNIAQSCPSVHREAIVWRNTISWLILLMILWIVFDFSLFLESCRILFWKVTLFPFDEATCFHPCVFLGTGPLIFLRTSSRVASSGYFVGEAWGE